MTSSRHQSSDISEPKKKTVISETHESIEIEAASVERGVLASESCGNEPPVNDNIQVVVTQLEDSARVADTPKVDSPSKADNVVVPTSSMKFPSSDTSDNVEGDRTPAAFQPVALTNVNSAHTDDQTPVNRKSVFNINIEYMHLNINKDDQAANRANNFSPSNDSKMHFLIEDSHSGSKSQSESLETGAISPIIQKDLIGFEKSVNHDIEVVLPESSGMSTPAGNRTGLQLPNQSFTAPSGASAGSDYLQTRERTGSQKVPTLQIQEMHNRTVRQNSAGQGSL